VSGLGSQASNGGTKPTRYRASKALLRFSCLTGCDLISVQDYLIRPVPSLPFSGIQGFPEIRLSNIREEIQQPLIGLDASSARPPGTPRRIRLRSGTSHGVSIPTAFWRRGLTNPAESSPRFGDLSGFLTLLRSYFPLNRRGFVSHHNAPGIPPSALFPRGGYETVTGFVPLLTLLPHSLLL
jgi:hypothetical protein